MQIYESDINKEIIDILITLSKDWEQENSCYGYRTNTKADIDGNRIFLAEKDGNVIGYLFGKTYRSSNMKAVMPEGTPYFEVEELYVIPSERRRGVGTALFRHAESVVNSNARYMVLGTATKNWKAILHFYLEELDMRFWSARLFKEI